MHLRRLFVGAALVVAAGLGLCTTSSAHAAPSVVFGPPAEGRKVTLGDTSIGGPALFTNPTGSPRAILAWTGTDAEHHLNYLTSSNGLDYINKHTLVETSPYRPAVSWDSTGRAGFIVIAWTGRDAAHTLNVEYIDAYNYTVARKLTLWGYTSLGAPGVAVFGGGEVELAWSALSSTGLHLYSLKLSPQGQIMSHRELSIGAAGGPSPESVNLSFDRSTGQLLLAWATPVQATVGLMFSTSTDGVNWAAARAIAEYSDSAESMVGIQASNMPTHWIAWTGTARDTAHHLNVQYTESFPNWANVGSKTTFDETDLNAPALGYVGVTGQMIVAWTGTDQEHHLNAEVVYVNH